jgi:hypothetical protein
MEELKLLVEMVASLPSMALWVIAFFFIYKVAVVGSIYGVVRFTVGKIHDWLITRKTREIEYKEIRPMLDGMCIKVATETLIAQLHRLRGKGIGIKSEYIHAQSVEWLRDAIDAKIADDAAKENAKAA